MKNVIEYEYDIEEIKNELTIEQIESLISDLGGEPIESNNILKCKTICHCGESHKLYYYPNTSLFKCYTDCGDTFDIFDLVKRVKSQNINNYTLPQAVRYVAQYFGYTPKIKNKELFSDSLEEYWDVLNSYNRIKNINKETQRVELKVYDESILKNLPRPRIKNWEDEGIKYSTLIEYGIKFNPKSQGIVIPHYDIKNNLVGIRERTLIQENAELYGKYRPAYINNKMYNHPLSFNLYGINKTKNNIAKIKKAIIFEGEKSVLLYDSYFGKENNIAVACCGSNIISYQVKLLRQIGVEEIVIALDKQFQEKGDEEFKKLVKNLNNIYLKYGNYINISFIFDKYNLTGYKCSPIDCGADIFKELFKKRINLYSAL